MKHVLAAVLCIAIPIAMFASDKDNGYKVTYDGGSVPDTKAGVGMKIYIEANQVRLAKDNVGLIWADGDKKGGLALQCDKNDYRGILAGLEGVSGKKAVDSETMTVKN